MKRVWWIAGGAMLAVIAIGVLLLRVSRDFSESGDAGLPAPLREAEAVRPAPSAPAQKTIAFWSDGLESPASDKVDVAYFEAGWNRAKLLPARGYVRVLRVEHYPPSRRERVIAEVLKSDAEEISRGGAEFLGARVLSDSHQIASDYLPVLRSLRKDLPSDVSIIGSIRTEWIEDGTATEIFALVDEAVVELHTDRDEAKLLDAEFMAALGRINKPFRIEASPEARGTEVSGVETWVSWRYASLEPDPPRDHLLIPSAFEFSHHTNALNRQVIVRTTKKEVPSTPYVYSSAGDVSAWSVPTPEWVRRMVEMVETLGPWCGGVLFSWRNFSVPFVMTLPEVQDAIQGRATASSRDYLETKDGACALVACQDLYIRLSNRVSSVPRRIRVYSSQPIEYMDAGFNAFGETMEPSIGSDLQERLIDIQVPPFPLVERIFVGRVVTIEPTMLSLESQR